MTTNELIQGHHKSLNILRMIKELEGKIKNAHDFLNNKDNPFYYEFDKDYHHNLEIYWASVRRLFERYEKLQTKLN